MAASILIERDGAVATITLNRPEVGNALDNPMTRALEEAVIACDEDDRVRAVLLTGAGRLFCGGGDIAAFHAAGEALPEYLEEMNRYLHGAVARLVRMRKPVIGAVNGAAVGSGLGIALLGDVVIADPHASFALAYAGVGLAPNGGATWLLPRLCGLRRAQQFSLFNRRVRAEEALGMGLVTHIAEEEELLEEAGAMAHELANAATLALGATRQLLLESVGATLEQHLEAEGRAIVAQARTAEAREGIASFIEKRVPNFVMGR